MDAVKLSNVSCIPFNHDQNTDSATDEEHPSKIAEIDTNLIKEELKTEEQEDVDNTEEVINFTCPKGNLDFRVGMGPKAILMRQSSHDLAIVADLYSLLEDFRTMAHSSKSLLCCQPASYPSVLMCPLCGDYFVGKADRMLNLCKHYETVHPSDALKLILDAMKTYKKLIAHMRKALEFDVWFGDVNYTTVKRNKSFECTECKIN
ncbi:uncharacterized protein LOC117652966 isoform X1 [Thrips palmi]|uniref:Uncharacterized protein LOC117652966 isoform X1 n=1 Tax=Thrips palmi TaxID=161013 RepID=A0A6P9A9X5_THRPL|nr:uncharacterized protein LOC117652966 isoform X1 [Thrips palmi]